MKLGRRDIITILTIFLFVLIFQSMLAASWSSYGVFDQYNVIFDADPNSWKSIFANGWSVGGFGHPLLVYFFSVPIRAIGALGSFFGFISDEVGFREALAIYVAPLCAALKAICLYLAFRLLNLGILDACLAAGFGFLSFSSVVFGATPSSYAVTGLGLALITLFALVVHIKADRVSYSGLLVAGLLAIGTTISNVIHFGWMHWATQTAKGRAPVSALVGSVVVGALVMFVVLSVFFVLSELRGVKRNSSDLMVTGDFLERYQPSVYKQVENFARFPEIVARTFIPTTPAQKENKLAIQNNNLIKFELTFNDIKFGIFPAILGTVSLLVFGGGAVLSYRHGGIWRWIGLASTASMVTFGILYSWFGINTFLYSQHWLVPSVFLIGAWLNCSFIRSRIGYGLISGALAFMLLSNFYVLGNINQWLLETQ